MQRQWQYRACNAAEDQQKRCGDDDRAKPVEHLFGPMIQEETGEDGAAPRPTPESLTRLKRRAARAIGCNARARPARPRGGRGGARLCTTNGEAIRFPDEPSHPLRRGRLVYRRVRRRGNARPRPSGVGWGGRRRPHARGRVVRRKCVHCAHVGAGCADGERLSGVRGHGCGVGANDSRLGSAQVRPGPGGWRRRRRARWRGIVLRYRPGDMQRRRPIRRDLLLSPGAMRLPGAYHELRRIRRLPGLPDRVSSFRVVRNTAITRAEIEMEQPL
jgi:hypothetical protein